MATRKHTPDGANINCIIYTRFSPRPDAANSESCEWQEQECRRYAEQKGLRVLRTFNDPDRSGADDLREVLWSAIEYLQRGDTLIVWKWDRLARALMLALQIERAVEQKGAQVFAVTGDVPGNDPQAQFMRHILMAVAELERKMISQRTSVAMKALQRSGRRMSALTPYGWVVDPNDESRLVEDPKEQEIRRLILDMRARDISFRRIAKTLYDEGIIARSGLAFNQATIRTICRRG